VVLEHEVVRRISDHRPEQGPLQVLSRAITLRELTFVDESMTMEVAITVMINSTCSMHWEKMF
jgi:hypothetical protein